MPLHLILETTKTADISFFLCTSAGADVPNRSGASHDGAVHPTEVRGKHMGGRVHQTKQGLVQKTGNYKRLYEMLTGHLKSITCPCRAFLVFFASFFTLTFCVLLCHFSGAAL